MITTDEDHATGASFRQAAPNTGMGKVFSNNMDNGSFVGESSIGLKLILNNRKTATYQYLGDAITSPELKNCLVSPNILESDMKKVILHKTLNFIVCCVNYFGCCVNCFGHFY